PHLNGLENKYYIKEPRYDNVNDKYIKPNYDKFKMKSEYHENMNNYNPFYGVNDSKLVSTSDYHLEKFNENLIEPTEMFNDMIGNGIEYKTFNNGGNYLTNECQLKGTYHQNGKTNNLKSNGFVGSKIEKIAKSNQSVLDRDVANTSQSNYYFSDKDTSNINPTMTEKLIKSGANS
ncbi:hypothetical protein A3Q56_08532, partial [Intoshia linei]